MTVTKHLEKNLGGKWKYDGHTAWWCDDEKRYVARTADLYNGDDEYAPPSYWLYSDETPRRAEKYMGRFPQWGYYPLKDLEGTKF